MAETLKSVVVFDVDDTAINFVPFFFSYYNYEVGGKFTPESLYVHDYPKVLGITQEEFQRRINLFYGTDEFKNLPPVPGAQTVIKTLTQEFHETIIGLTARPEVIADKTRFQLDTHFLGQFQYCHHLGIFDEDLPGGQRPKKSDVCKKLKVKMFVEDVAEYAIDVAQLGIPTYLRRCPWNVSFSDEELSSVGVTSFRTLEELLEIISRDHPN